MAMEPMPMLRPPKPPPPPDEPPSSRRSSTLSDSRLPSHFMTAFPLRCGSRSWQRHAALALVFATSIFVAGFTDFVALKKQDLGTTFTGVDLGRQRRRVAEFERDIASVSYTHLRAH